MTYLLGSLRDSGRVEQYCNAEQFIGMTDKVFNPVEKVISIEMDAIEIYRRDIIDMLYCDTVALLPGWRRSKTARQMVKVAKFAELGIIKVPKSVTENISIK